MTYHYQFEIFTGGIFEKDSLVLSSCNMQHKASFELYVTYQYPFEIFTDGIFEKDSLILSSCSMQHKASFAIEIGPTFHNHVILCLWCHRNWDLHHGSDWCRLVLILIGSIKDGLSHSRIAILFFTFW
jgi:hypothetical protein